MGEEALPPALSLTGPFLLYGCIGLPPVATNLLLTFIATFSVNSQVIFYMYSSTSVKDYPCFSSAQIICYLKTKNPLALVGLLGLWIWYMGVLQVFFHSLCFSFLISHNLCCLLLWSIS